MVEFTLEYTIHGRVVTEEEFWKDYMRNMGLGNFTLLLPKRLYFAVEYGEPLPANSETVALIRKSVAEEFNLSGKELDAMSKKQYAIYTRKHVPYPFINVLHEISDKITKKDLEQGKFKAKVLELIRNRLKEYNSEGVCTLGLAKKIKIDSSKERSNDKNEYEAV